MSDALLSALGQYHPPQPSEPFWFCMVDDKPPPTMEDIKSVVMKHYGVSRSDINSNRRRQPAALARQVAMYLCYRLTDHTHSVIGRSFKKCDHTVSLYACWKIELAIRCSEKFAKEIATLEARFA